MVVLNYTGGEVNAKIVYYGPGLSGKTTNLEFIHDRTPEGSRGKMVSMKTQTDRTLFFDFLPLELGEINGYRTRFLLYTVPGQVYYNATRKLVLKGVDALVFVADSSRSKLDENLESLRNLEQNLNEHGMSLDELPWVIQYNKRDAADAMAVADLDARLNPLRVPSHEAVATLGNGVYETFHAIATLVYSVLKERLERELGAPATAPAPASPVQAASAPGRRVPPAEGEVEFDNAIDSMLREMDGPAGRPATRVPIVLPGNVQGTINAPAPAPSPAPAPVAPVASKPAVYVSAPQPTVQNIATQSAAPPAGTATNVEIDERRSSPRPSGVFDRAREAFDLELGRLPALEDAAFASDHARSEGPNEFVTDPMRRAVPKEITPAPVRVEPRVEPRVEARVEAVVEIEPQAEPALAPTLIHLPVVLTRAQTRPGASIRLVLDISVTDE